MCCPHQIFDFLDVDGLGSIDLVATMGAAPDWLDDLDDEVRGGQRGSGLPVTGEGSRGSKALLAKPCASNTCRVSSSSTTKAGHRSRHAALLPI